jgi:SAM-dependent methyltransferase
MAASDQTLFARDLQQTRDNRERLRANANLLFWYKQLYDQIFSEMPDLGDKQILEIGSGTSPLKLFYPSVVTSDVLPLDYLDHVFDCHEIDRYDGIADHSIDVISLTNVLHHLGNPLEFLEKATRKLKPDGQIIAVEPYFSALSYPLYKLLHHEPVDFGIARPRLESIKGPLSSSNQAIPHMLFVSRLDWLAELAPFYDTDNIRLDFFSGLSYMATGGISRSLPVPGVIYRPLFAMDRIFARTAPRLFASFFIARLTARITI